MRASLSLPHLLLACRASVVRKKVIQVQFEHCDHPCFEADVEAQDFELLATGRTSMRDVILRGPKNPAWYNGMRKTDIFETHNAGEKLDMKAEGYDEQSRHARFAECAVEIEILHNVRTARLSMTRSKAGRASTELAVRSCIRNCAQYPTKTERKESRNGKYLYANGQLRVGGELCSSPCLVNIPSAISQMI